MFRKILPALALAALFASSMASAQWTGSVSYSRFSDDADVDALVGSFGYAFEVADSFYLVPELRAGFGIGDDSFNVNGDRVKVEIDRLWGFSNRFQYEFATGFYLFGVASYVNYELEATIQAGPARIKVSDDSWEFGFGGGLGYMFTPNFGTDFSYERIDDVDAWTLGLRFRF